MNYFKKNDTEYYIDPVEDYREWVVAFWDRIKEKKRENPRELIPCLGTKNDDVEIAKSVKEVDGLGVNGFINPTTYLGESDFRTMRYESMLIKINKRMKIKILTHFEDRIRSGECTKQDASAFMIVSERMCVEYLDYIMFKESRIDVELIKREYEKMTEKHDEVNLSDFISLGDVLGCTIKEIRKKMTEKAVVLFKGVGTYYPRDMVYYGTMCGNAYDMLFEEFYKKRISEK